MRFGVNARRLAGQRLGIGRYIEYLVKYWSEMVQAPDRVTLYVQGPLGGNGLHLSETVGLKALPSRVSGVLWENLVLSRRSSELDVLFGPSYTLPLNYRGRSVVATHSINEVESGTHPWWYKLSYSQIYRISAQRANRVIVPSQSTKKDVQRHYGIPSEKIDVVPEGADESFQPIDDPELIRATRLRYLGVDRPYILFVGKFSQRRNVPLIVEAFAEVKKREKIPHYLLLNGPNVTGVPLAEMAERLGITDSLVHVNDNFADHRELVPLFASADLYVFPSSYEGFSLTTVEAMACGVPVVAANRAALAEIAGGYGMMIDDLTVGAIADAMARALTDRDLHDELSLKSRTRARMLTWEKTARGTLDVLQQVAHQG